MSHKYVREFLVQDVLYLQKMGSDCSVGPKEALQCCFVCCFAAAFSALASDFAATDVVFDATLAAALVDAFVAAFTCDFTAGFVAAAFAEVLQRFVVCIAFVTVLLLLHSMFVVAIAAFRFFCSCFCRFAGAFPPGFAAALAASFDVVFAAVSVAVFGCIAVAFRCFLLMFFLAAFAATFCCY